MYTIVASVCQHPIRQSHHLPWSGSTLDFSVQYCDDCLNRRTVHRRRDEAERNYATARFRHDNNRIPRSELRERQRSYDHARIAVRGTEDYWADRDDRERREAGRRTRRESGRAFADLDDPEWVAFARDMGVRGYRNARVADGPSVSHRHEEAYRPQREFRRESRQYEPGRYSSSSEFYDTSGYYDADGAGTRRRCLLYTSPSPRDGLLSRMPSSA